MIILMGSVGSGKTEQGKRLVSKLKCPRISTSQLLRDHLTEKIQKDMIAGKLVDDDSILKLLEPALEAIPADKREFVLDGAPRSILQADWLIKEINLGKINLTGVINLNVSDEVVIDRLLRRGRKDDQKTIIMERLNQYHSITSPVLAFLEEQGIDVHNINGEDEPAVVEKNIGKALGLI